MNSKAVGFWMVILTFVILPIAANLYSGGHSSITLRAKSWNNGHVHLWHDLSDSPTTTFTDVADGTRCQQLDSQTHKMGDGLAVYYRLNCNGVIGYVETDQAY